MKNNEQKMARMEDILNLPVQDPPCPEFSAAHINWVKVEGGRQGGDDIALIPFSRVEEFVKGESSNSECPANFRIESRRRRSEGSVSKPRVDGYLEYTLYWCSYGPEDYRDIESEIGDSTNHKPASGKGSRPGRRHMMRGCLCHFTVKRLYTRPLLALIIYNQRSHVDKTGAPCHGVLDRDAVGTRAMYAPRISEELRQKVMSMLYVGISFDDIIQHHIAEVDRHGGPSSRDDFLTRNDVRNMERVIRQSTYQLHCDDVYSVRMWAQRHQKNVFFFQDTSVADFVLGIQTEWQLQQMIRYGHNSSIACHSSFGRRKLRYPLCTLLVFDSYQNAIPVAWIITSSSDGQNVCLSMGSLVERIRTKEPGWIPHAFLMDDPSFEIPVIRDAIPCRILVCLWYIRRAWIRNLLRNCCNFDVQREMFKHLGRILYCARSDPCTLDAIMKFTDIFIDQSTFMDYFKDEWLPKIEIWVTAMRTLPVANLEFHAAIESYHLRLKSKLFNEEHAGSWLRVDWLVHALTTEFHAFYWFDVYSQETGYFKNTRDISTNSWSGAYTVWNPGSEFALCDCTWSRLGNICKHVIKNPPDDPIVLDHAILHATRLRQDIKGLEDLSNSGLLQALPSLQTGGHVGDGLLNLPNLS